MHTMVPNSFDENYDQVKRYVVIADGFRVVENTYRFFESNNTKAIYPVGLTIIKNIEPYEEE